MTKSTGKIFDEIIPIEHAKDTVFDLSINAKEAIGKQLAKIRLQKKIKQKDVADAIGYTDRNLSKYEKAEHKIGFGFNTAFKYAKAIGITTITINLNGQEHIQSFKNV